MTTIDKETVFQIFFSLRTSLVRLVSTIVPQREIEDIVQETYIRVCQVEHPSQIRCPKSFMLKVARNLAFDYVKKAETRLAIHLDNTELQALQDLEVTDADEIYTKVVADQEFSHFCEALRRLPVQCRKVFVLKKVYGYTQKEIAECLNLSESTIEKHVAYGIKHCTQYMLALED
jgi:RNA polymerase sigma factor (sigma-70 family)